MPNGGMEEATDLDSDYIAFDPSSGVCHLETLGNLGLTFLSITRKGLVEMASVALPISSVISPVGLEKHDKTPLPPPEY